MGVWNVSVPGPSLPPYRVLHKGTTTVFARSRPSSQLALVFGGRLQKPGDAIVESRGRGRPYQDEFRRLCKKYGVTIDERYVWN